MVRFFSRGWPAGSTASQIQDRIDSVLKAKGLLKVVGEPTIGGKNNEFVNATLECADDLALILKILWLDYLEKFNVEVPGGKYPVVASLSIDRKSFGDLEKYFASIDELPQRLQGAPATIAIEQPAPKAPEIPKPQPKNSARSLGRNAAGEHEFDVCLETAQPVTVRCGQDSNAKMNVRFTAEGKEQRCNSVSEAVCTAKTFRVSVRLISKPNAANSVAFRIQLQNPPTNSGESAALLNSQIWI